MIVYLLISKIVYAQEQVIAKGDLYARRKCNGVSPSSPAALSASSQQIVVLEGETPHAVPLPGNYLIHGYVILERCTYRNII